MHKLLKLILISLIIFSLKLNFSYGAKGPADIYKVTMEKIEFCTGYETTDFNNIATADTACKNAVTIGTGQKEVDIASVSAGAQVAAYGETKLLPLGTTFTHVRVTINREFKIKSDGAIDTGSSGDTDDCKTIASTDAMYGTTIAARKYTHRPVVAEGGTNAEMRLFLANGGKDGDTCVNYKSCDDANCSSVTNSNWQYPGAADLVSAVAMENMYTKSGDTIALVYQLANPIIVGMVTPKVDIAFGTQNAVGVNEVSSLCQFYPEEPIVEITVK